jgi:hypothetical protein
MSFASGYSLDLYCDSGKPHAYGSFPAQYFGETWGEVKQQAQAAGWLFKRDRMTVICPKCNDRRRPTSGS